MPVSLTSFGPFHPCGISFSTVAQHLHQLCQCPCWRLPNKSGFRHNYALSTQMAGVLLSSKCLQLGPITSVLHLNFSCLSWTRNPSNYRCLSRPQASDGDTLTVPLCQSPHHQARLDLLPNCVSTLSPTLSPYNLPLLLQQPL